MRVGFTGTRHGMTGPQFTRCERAFAALGAGHPGHHLGHGDCEGSDEQAHSIVRQLGWTITIFPSLNESKRAWCVGAHIVQTPKEYLERDRDIVVWCEILVATPYTRQEVRRSGTWYTIRQARQIGRDWCIIYPDGDYEAPFDLGGDLNSDTYVFPHLANR